MASDQSKSKVDSLLFQFLGNPGACSSSVVAGRILSCTEEGSRAVAAGSPDLDAALAVHASACADQDDC